MNVTVTLMDKEIINTDNEEDSIVIYSDFNDRVFLFRSG